MHLCLISFPFTFFKFCQLDWQLFVLILTLSFSFLPRLQVSFQAFSVVALINPFFHLQKVFLDLLVLKLWHLLQLPV